MPVARADGRAERLAVAAAARRRPRRRARAQPVHQRHVPRDAAAAAAHHGDHYDQAVPDTRYLLFSSL